MYIVGDISQETLLAFMPKFFHLESLCKKNEIDTMTIHLATNGGNIEPGLAMYDILKNSDLKIRMICHGYVYSCGTFVLQAADERIAMPNSTFLLHPFSLSIENTDFNIHNWLKMLQSINDMINNIMIDRGFQQSFLNGKDKEDIYLSAREALTYGLVDSILRK